jgi:iron complex transport system permease protein
MDRVGVEALQRKHAALAGRKKLFVAALVGSILAVAAAAICLGSFPVSVARIPAILGRAALGMAHPDPEMATVVLILRLPRIVMGVLAGIGLGVAGAVLQGILRNPLASPTTIGISAAAGLGAALALILGVGSGGGQYLLIASAFVFAMVPAAVIFLLARRRGATPEIMILAGIGLLYIFSALTSLLQYVASDDALRSMVLWLMGDLGRAKWAEIGAASAVLVLCVPLLVYKAWDLNVMAAGDETAQALGIHPERNRLLLMGVASLTTATIICFTGMIGFIGLVAPHICRMVIGGDHRYLLPASGVFGAAFLLLADVAARTLLSPVIIPVGIITACAGGPLFLYLILTHKRRHW